MLKELQQPSSFFVSCHLCPRNCRVNRLEGQRGRCRVGADLKVARAALHFWEEPCISGERGSGAVFFSGCSLGCAYCQNEAISDGRSGKEITPERLREIFLELQAQGAHNLNLVTACHYVPWVLTALTQAREQGFTLPVVYNSSGYESVETLRLLEGFVDVYLPDMKYAEPALARDLSGAEDYPKVALSAIAEMLRQCGNPVFDAEGMITRGTIIRHLVLPGHTKNSRRVLDLLAERFGTEISLSLMNQYTPMTGEGCLRLSGVAKTYPELLRRVTAREYEKVLDHAFSLGLDHGFFQEGETAKESFIPPFNGDGV